MRPKVAVAVDDIVQALRAIGKVLKFGFYLFPGSA